MYIARLNMSIVTESAQRENVTLLIGKKRETQAALGGWSGGDVARLGCRNWKIVALNREGWKKL